MLGARGQPVFGALLVGTMLVFIIRDLRRAPGGLKGSTFVAMLGESVVLAGVFGSVVGLLTAQVVGAVAGSASGAGPGLATRALAMGGLDGPADSLYGRLPLLLSSAKVSVWAAIRSAVRTAEERLSNKAKDRRRAQ